MRKTAVVLGIFALLGTAIMFITFKHSQPYIKENERQVVLRTLQIVLPGKEFDNDIVSDVIMAVSRQGLGSTEPLPVYRARKQGQPVAAVLTVIAPDGYGGPIKLLVGVRVDGSISGVRVVAHRETPGLGDAIEESRSDWITSFNGKSLENTGTTAWRVRKEGGDFDQFTGATITPRAIVTAVHNALQYYQGQRDTLFTENSGKTLYQGV
ncbi:MAG: electron transport complex subunit RsxG [Granulosicoccaceae bacterium]|jgi:electron transport complex protein RnfG